MTTKGYHVLHAIPLLVQRGLLISTLKKHILLFTCGAIYLMHILYLLITVTQFWGY